MSRFTDEQINSAYSAKEEEAKKILEDENNTTATLNKAKRLLGKIKKVPVIGGLVDDITTLIELIGDYVKGRYRDVPLRIIVSAMAAIIYLISPIDLVPDIIPIIGWVDDATVISFVLSMGVSAELRRYRNWKQETENRRISDNGKIDLIKKLAKELDDAKAKNT